MGTFPGHMWANCVVNANDNLIVPWIVRPVFPYICLCLLQVRGLMEKLTRNNTNDNSNGILVDSKYARN